METLATSTRLGSIRFIHKCDAMSPDWRIEGVKYSMKPEPKWFLSHSAASPQPLRVETEVHYCPWCGEQLKGELPDD